MIFEQLNPDECRTYLIASEDTNDAVIVDPVFDEVENYSETIEKKGLSLKYIIDTHTHADHISGSRALNDRTGAKYVMYKNAPLKCLDLKVGEGDELEVGRTPIKFIHTPGHTKDSMTLLLPDRILTGDVLFIGGAGRTDLIGGDSGEHYDSLFNKLYPLDDSLLVFPAHDYHNKISSTLGEEKKQNDHFQKRGREEYIAWLESMRESMPEWMKDVIHENYSCKVEPKYIKKPEDEATCEVGTGAITGRINSQEVSEIDASELSSMLSSSELPLLIDVRQPGEYESGHIKGARLIPLGGLAKRIGELEEYKDKDIITICRSGGRSSTAASILSQAGFNKVQSLKGGMLEWEKRT
ncbi:MAG: MBL fold metallo-hydrolase [Halobacteriota archaeon]|nr:MBL fold metallo-hydrolase [Halobacteriota archaeon]